MILVTGATGQLGQIVIEKLSEKIPTNQIAALVRDASKADHLIAKGVNVRVGDYQNGESLLAAFQGIDKLLLISSNDFNDRLGQHKNAIDAAVKAGVKHVFYTGVTMNNINSSPLKPLLEEHFLTEDYLKATGLSYTFLQNSLYAEVIPMFLGENVIETGVFFPAGEGKVAFALREDLGEATANILVSEGHVNQTYNLTGSEVISFAEVAAILSELSEKAVSYINPESEVFEGTLKQFGLPEPIIQMSVMFAAGIKNNDFNKTYDSLERFLGRKPTNIRTYLKAVYKL
ncbi:SDR family oxidoreductase [Lacihabitans sp. CS3-21]|uniref:SDR family oxidoreductase n=1 Tax=Lacihabitans sp. CS3-21 TaxID=2487332 RepID=UPI0020CCC403|nr:SDR family oxidoreductase [Lacihabitans sp. CS3-21]MCP9745211.1 SDR family oxidoreductase [Lacihabitans sp. CS3-21]